MYHSCKNRLINTQRAGLYSQRREPSRCCSGLNKSDKLLIIFAYYPVDENKAYIWATSKIKKFDTLQPAKKNDGITEKPE